MRTLDELSKRFRWNLALIDQPGACVTGDLIVFGIFGCFSGVEPHADHCQRKVAHHVISDRFRESVPVTDATEIRFEDGGNSII
jgi:hypothetical protein